MPKTLSFKECSIPGQIKLDRILLIEFGTLVEKKPYFGSVHCIITSKLTKSISIFC